MCKRGVEFAGTEHTRHMAERGEKTEEKNYEQQQKVIG